MIISGRVLNPFESVENNPFSFKNVPETAFGPLVAAKGGVLYGFTNVALPGLIPAI